LRLSPRYKLILILFVAFIIDYIPVLNRPFLWSETFFHEISHGLAAILTGGKIQSIVLNFDASGLCTTSGGNAFLITFAGYASSAIWGLALYVIAGIVSPRKAKIIASVMLLIITSVLILWAKNISTIIILISLIIMYGAILYNTLWVSVKYLIQVIGVFVMIDAIRSPLYLFDGRDLGDGATLAKITWLPEVVWIAIWFIISVASLCALWLITKDKQIDNEMISEYK